MEHSSNYNFNDLVIDNIDCAFQQEPSIEVVPNLESLEMGIARFERSRQKPSPSLENLFSNRDVLAQRLKNRPDRDDLIDRNIIPAHSTAPSITNKVSLLERKKTGDFLQKKIRARPSRQQLVQRHILSDHRVDATLLENLSKLERQKIADHLNERLLLRPGPIELIQENILPVESPIQNAVERVTYESHGSESNSPTAVPDLESGFNAYDCSSPSPPPASFADHFANRNMMHHEPNISTLTISQNISLSQKENEKLVRSVNKKTKQSKQKVKKLKFHECRPPDMPDVSAENPVDERYQRLLEQQTLYLRLQVMQQNAMLNALQGNTEVMETVTEEIENVMKEKERKTSETQVLASLEGKRLDDLKVIDLRAQLKQRGLLVSGSKAKLIERLIAFEEGKSSPSDFSYSGGLSNESMQKVSSPPASSVDMKPATTLMQVVTTYATDSTGQTYQVIQAVPQATQNLMQYQVMSGSGRQSALSPVHMDQLNIQPVVAVTQPHVMTIQESVSDNKQNGTNMRPSLTSPIQFQLTPPPQQPSPTFVLHQGPQLQRAAMMQHEKHKVQIQHIPYNHSQYFSQPQQHTITQLSQSLLGSQSSNIPPNSQNVSMQGNKTNTHIPLSASNSLDSSQFRGRTISEPGQYKRSKSYGNEKLLTNGVDKNANVTNLSLDDKINLSGSHPLLSTVGMDQRQLPGNKMTGLGMKSHESYDDIMDILGELTTPSPTNMGSPIPASAGYSMAAVKTEAPPMYNACAFDNSKQRTQVNKFLNVNNQPKPFSSVPENMNILGTSPSQNFLSTPYGSLGGSHSGSMTNLQSHLSSSYNNLNTSSSTGNLLQQTDSFQNLSSSYNSNPSSYMKIDYNSMSPISMNDDNLSMDLESLANTQNNTLNWLDLNMEPSSPTSSLQYQSKDIGSNNSLSNAMNMNNSMMQQNTMFGNSNASQVSIYGSSPRPQDGFANLFDLEGPEY